MWFFLVVSLETIRIQLFCLFVFPEKNKFTHIKRAKACVVLLYQQNLRSRSSYLFKIQKLNILCKIYINIFIIIKYRFLSCFTYTIGHLLLTKECPDIRAYGFSTSTLAKFFIKKKVMKKIVLRKVSLWEGFVLKGFCRAKRNAFCWKHRGKPNSAPKKEG